MIMRGRGVVEEGRGVSVEKRGDERMRTIIEAQQGDMSVYAKRCLDKLFLSSCSCNKTLELFYR